LYEIFKQVNGNGVATLIKNSDDLIESIGAENQFRLIATLYDKHANTHDILPYLKVTANKKDLKLSYITRKHEMMSHFNNDQIKLSNNKKENENEIKNKFNNRALNGAPVQMYGEVVLVADQTIYNDHVIFAGTTTQSLVFLHMRIYFTHVMNGVNQRYINSLSSDPDLRLTISLKNILISTSTPTWSASTGVTFEGRDVIIAATALNAFKAEFESQSLTFTYDHAVALTK
jgi:hypothetical protein